MNLQFGLGRDVPEAVPTAWGARWIWPDDMLPDRQDVFGPDFGPLKAWLNKKGLSKAKLQARRCAGVFIHPGKAELVILYLDGEGIIVANSNASHGYLYVAAWIHNGRVDKQAPSGTLDLTHRRKGVRA